MIRFLDLEASSLLPGSFPIEIAWVDEDGRGESHLIRPPERWLRRDRGMPGWSAESERVHGIGLQQLLDQGEPVEEVARRAKEALLGSTVIVASDAPDFDGRWLATLLDAGGVRTRATLVEVSRVYVLACAPLLRAISPSDKHAIAAVQGLILEIEEREERRDQVRHRALPDAEKLWRTWRAIADEVARRIVEANRS